MCRSFLSIFFFFCQLGLAAQPTDYFIINDILLVGNNHTTTRVIYNELEFGVGDTLYIANFGTDKLENEKRLLGTALFTGVEMNIKNWDTEQGIADIEFTFQENWYIYPSLIFELADRNFNVWWSEMNRDLDRVNYGVGLDHINLTGNKDKLKLKIQQGYTRKYEIKYNYPYITQTWGMFGEIFYADQKEIGYTTQNNKTLFHQEADERVLLSRFRTSIGAAFRPDVFHFHDFKLEYHHNAIDDFVAREISPDYFLEGQTDLYYFALKYDFVLDKRIFNLYPEGGTMLFANITKEGLGFFDDFNNLSVAVGLEKYFQLGKNTIWGGRFKAKTNLIRNQVAFANNTGLGYGNDIVRGYELYVVDGTDWVLAKTSLRHKLFEKDYSLGQYMMLQQFRKMNLRVFARANLDFGYVNEPTYTATNELNNRLLVGYGPAIDILLYHTYIMSFEYSINHLGESGLYLRSTFNF